METVQKMLLIMKFQVMSSSGFGSNLLTTLLLLFLIFVYVILQIVSFFLVFAFNSKDMHLITNMRCSSEGLKEIKLQAMGEMNLWKNAF